MNRRKAEQWISMSLDGELSPRRAAKLERVLERQPELMDLKEQWASYRTLVHASIPDTPQTPEAAWQDVQRAIRLDADREEARSVEARFGWRIKWASAMALTVLLVLGGIFYAQYRVWHEVGVIAQADRTVVEWVESDLPDAMSMVYEDADTGVTVIWILTAENGEEDKHAG